MRGRRGVGRVYRRKGSRYWWIEFRVRGKPYRESSKSTRKEDADNLLFKRIQQYRLIPGLVERPLMGEFVDDYLRDLERRGSRSMWVMERRCSLVKEFCGHELASDIDARRATQLQDWLTEKGMGPATVNAVLSALSASLRLGARQGRLAQMPTMPQRLREPKPRQGFFEYADFVAILEELPEWARDPFAFLYHSGWRKMEGLTLRWDEIDLEGGVIRLDPERSKNREGRTLPILGEIAAILERRAKKRDLRTPCVFHRKGHCIDRTTFGKTFKDAATIAGRGHLHIHDARRTVVRTFERLRIPRSVAMAWIGHRSEAIYRRYFGIVNEEDLREQGQKLADEMERKKREAERKVLPFKKGEG